MKQKDIYDFQEYETIRSFGDNICGGKIDIDKTEIDQSNLWKNTVEFQNMPRPKTIEGKDKKEMLMMHVRFMKAKN